MLTALLIYIDHFILVLADNFGGAHPDQAGVLCPDLRGRSVAGGRTGRSQRGSRAEDDGGLPAQIHGREEVHRADEIFL